jgi:hypothetical protein
MSTAGSQRCVATSRSGTRCRNWAIRGGSVCRFHGGAAPQVRAAAKRRLAEAASRKKLHEFEIEEVEDPVEAYAQLASEAVAPKNLLAGHVASLDAMFAADAEFGEQAKAELAAYERAMDRAGKLLADWIRLGIDERQIRVTEAQATMLFGVVNGALAELGVDVSDPHVGAVLARPFRAIDV